MKQFIEYMLTNKVHTVSAPNAIKQLPRILSGLASHNPMVLISKGASDIGVKELLISGWEQESVNTVNSPFLTYPPISSEEISSDTAIHLAHAFVEHGHDSIIAAGGGTVMDLAKVVKLSLQGQHATLMVKEGYRIDAFTTPCPMVFIPTTIGSGSGATQIAYINDKSHGRVLRFENYALLPDVTIIDPKMTKSVSPSQTAIGVAAILGRAMESMISVLAVPTSKRFALHAIRLLQEHSFRVVHTPHDLEARHGIAIASHLAGFATAATKGSLAHASAIAIEKLAGVPYGQCMRILLPHVLRFNFIGSEQALAHIGTTIGIGKPPSDDNPEQIGEAASATLEWVDRFFANLTKSLSVPVASRFYDLLSPDGKQRLIQPEHLEQFAQTIHGSVDILTSRHPTDVQDIIRILEAAYWGYLIDQDERRYKHQQNPKRKEAWKTSSS